MRTHLSVVGSGPILHPMKSSPSRYLAIRERVLSILTMIIKLRSNLMNVVLPVEYWPTRRTEGRQENSASSSGGLWRPWKR